MATTRTDTHSPKNFDPADYRVIDYLDNKPPAPPHHYDEATVALYKQAREAWQADIFRHFPDWRTGGDDHRTIFQCNHCGHQGIRYVAVVEHIPTGKRLAFGEICADRTELAGRDSFRAKFVKDAAAKARAKYERELGIAQTVAAAGEAGQWLLNLNSDYDSKLPDFFLSLKRQLLNKGELSERQIEALQKGYQREQDKVARIAAEQEALKDAPVLAEGRYEVEGTILSTRVDSNFYGSVFKCLVKLENGNKVWGSVPKNIEELTFNTTKPAADGNGYDVVEGIDLKGQRIKFTAKVERSQDDEHFGFYSRPTKAELLS